MSPQRSHPGPMACGMAFQQVAQTAPAVGQSRGALQQAQSGARSTLMSASASPRTLRAPRSFRLQAEASTSIFSASPHSRSSP